MAYYDALVAKWAQAPAGTNDQKLAWVNSQTAIGPAIRMLIPPYEIYNRVDRAEYDALQATKQSPLQRNLALDLIDFSPNSGERNLFFSTFSAASKTQANLKPYCDTFDKPVIPWAQSAGYPVPITPTMLVEAGCIPPGPTTPLPPQ